MAMIHFFELWEIEIFLWRSKSLDWHPPAKYDDWLRFAFRHQELIHKGESGEFEYQDALHAYLKSVGGMSLDLERRR
jgi:hypothetical protein